MVDNLSPLFVPHYDTQELRPQTNTCFDNLFLAGDFTRTAYDVPSMEGANESGKRAANAIIDYCQISDAEPVKIF